MKGYVLAIICVFVVAFSVQGQKVAVKTNLFSWSTRTLNMSGEIGLGKRTTLAFTGTYNPFTFRDNRKWKHYSLLPEFRYWTCERFYGHFFGIHAGYTHYNVSRQHLPFLNFSSDKRYEGWGVSAGLSYGYSWILGKRWNLEAFLGVGLFHTRYSTFKCYKCSKKIDSFTKNYLVPTRMGINIVYMIK